MNDKQLKCESWIISTIQKMKLEQDMEIQRQKVDFERQQLEMEGGLKETEMEYELEVKTQQVDENRRHFTFL